MDEIQAQIALNKRRVAQEKAEHIYRENSRKRLVSILDQKFKTTMIGAIARFEEAFGELWGHRDNSPSIEQLKFRRIWDEVRKDILDNGNKQRRAAHDEVSQYTMSWDKYKTEFIVRKEQK